MWNEAGLNLVVKKDESKNSGLYYKCTNDNCQLYWEYNFHLCQVCGKPLKAVKIKEDSSEEEVK